MDSLQVYIDLAWNHRSEIAAWIVSALVATTAAVHALQRLAAAFARLAAKTSSKADDEAAAKLTKWLSWCDGALSSVARWLPRVGVGARKPWSDAERRSRAPFGPSEPPGPPTPSIPPGRSP